MWRCVSIILILNVALLKCDNVAIVTAKGTVIGKNVADGNYSTFFGIPYAKVNEDNPFGNSLEYPNFETPFEATDPSIRCPQVIRVQGGVTQCLRLNIYVPNTANVAHPVPVLVWFYGGGFIMGSAGEYDGKYLIKHDIIVVTVNYRLGPYGFLCLDDSKVPGNQGLKDQIDALKWVKENIGAFGGDVSKVTIAGESYGGGSVDLHLYSLYETLFDKAIIQSGSMHVEGMFVKGDYDAPIKLAKQLGQNVSSTNQALEFLAKHDPLEVMKALSTLKLELRPCREKRFKGVQNFVTHDPFHLQGHERLRNTSILIGYNSKEDFGRFANKPEDFYVNLGDYFKNKIEKNFVLRKHDSKTLTDIVKTFYLGGKNVSQESMLELIDFSSDIQLTHAAERSVDEFMNRGAHKVYKYLFSYVGGSPYKNITGVGAYHTEELQYLFDMSSKLNSDEQKLIRDRMTTMWANFVKFGDPTPTTSALLPVQWKPVINNTRPYLNIDTEMTMGDHVYHERVSFWKLIWLNYWRNSVIINKRKH